MSPPTDTDLNQKKKEKKNHNIILFYLVSICEMFSRASLSQTKPNAFHLSLTIVLTTVLNHILPADGSLLNLKFDVKYLSSFFKHILVCNNTGVIFTLIYHIKAKKYKLPSFPSFFPSSEKPCYQIVQKDSRNYMGIVLKYNSDSVGLG